MTMNPVGLVKAKALVVILVQDAPASLSLINLFTGIAREGRSDVGWMYASTTKLQCICCQNVYTGVIYRFKHRFAQTIQNVEPCKVAPKYEKME